MAIYPFNASPCRLCSRPIGNRTKTAWYCWDCTHKSKKPRTPGLQPKAYAIPSRTPLIVDGRRLCLDCKAPISNSDGKALRCRGCRNVRTGVVDAVMGAAVSAVNKAVKKGLLPRVSTQVCVDCGRQAQVYDHRHYGRPLDVVPVCRSCNTKRGQAVFPHPYCAYGAKPAFPCELCRLQRMGYRFTSLIQYGQLRRGAAA